MRSTHVQGYFKSRRPYNSEKDGRFDSGMFVDTVKHNYHYIILHK